MKTLILGLINRFKEPSSWAAITALIVGALPTLAGSEQSIGLLLAGLAGVIAILVSEKSTDAK